MKDRLSELVHKMSQARVLVFGDLVLDQFIFGEISRISREAPVLILRYIDTQFHAGGAGNAAANLAALGATVQVVGLCGEDDNADKLRRCWSERVDTGGIIALAGHLTTSKTRILAGSLHSHRQQVVRLDVESAPRLTPEVQDRLWQTLQQRLDHCHVVVISDYGLGAVLPVLFERLRDVARERDIPVLVDSRFGFGRVSDVTGATPNISEFEEALNLKTGADLKLLEAAGRKSRAAQRLDFLLITRGRFGMSLFEKDDRVTHIPIYGSDEVTDVTGAGDTVIATAAAALAAGANFFEAAMLSNYAGGIVVMKRGTATVSPEELLDALESDATES